MHTHAEVWFANLVSVMSCNRYFSRSYFSYSSFPLIKGLCVTGCEKITLTFFFVISNPSYLPTYFLLSTTSMTNGTVNWETYMGMKTESCCPKLSLFAYLHKSFSYVYTLSSYEQCFSHLAIYLSHKIHIQLSTGFKIQYQQKMEN